MEATCTHEIASLLLSACLLQGHSCKLDSVRRPEPLTLSCKAVSETRLMVQAKGACACVSHVGEHAWLQEQ